MSRHPGVGSLLTAALLTAALLTAACSSPDPQEPTGQVAPTSRAPISAPARPPSELPRPGEKITFEIDNDAPHHYAEHVERPFFGELVAFITRGPLVAIVLEGTDVVAAARQLIGATNPIEAAPGSIRGDFATEVTFNLVHGSDSDQSAEREIALWFPEL